MKICCENLSLLVAYHHVHINGPCVLLDLQMGLFLFWKSILIGLYVMKLEATILEVSTKNIMWSNILFLFSIAFMKSSQSSDFVDLPKCRLSYWEVFAARILGSARLMDPSSELQLIRSMWSKVYLTVDTFANYFLWFPLNLAVKFVGNNCIDKIKYQVLLRLLVQNDLA